MADGGDVLFNSLEFAVFFPIVVGLYFFAVPHAWRWLWLLAASCYFYMVFIPEYILILGLTIVVDYYAGLKIEASHGALRRFYLWTSVIITCGILFFFKYLDFVWEAGHDLRELLGQSVSVNERAKFGFYLPIGLSFHTFQSLSYVIEVFRGRQKAERHFGIYALYVLFFPQLVAGPIERPQNLLWQFRVVKTFDVARVSSGLRMMLWGMFQKTVVADRLAIVVDYVYSGTEKAPPDALFVAAVFFAFQIFADFQGYTNIARGAARVLGFELMVNFNRPYAALSVTEFWRRWHISLSSWFRDYVYIPLDGGRTAPARGVFNLMVTFILSGLWHGANWTFVVWGALNGLMVALERAAGLKPTVERRPGLHYALRLVYTFMIVTVGWVFFRAASLKEAWLVLGALPEGLWLVIERLATGRIFAQDLLDACGISAGQLYVAVAALIAMEAFQLFEKPDMGERIKFLKPHLRWATYVVFLLVVLYSWMYFPASKKPFIYFQF